MYSWREWEGNWAPGDQLQCSAGEAVPGSLRPAAHSRAILTDDTMSLRMGAVNTAGRGTCKQHASTAVLHDMLVMWGGGVLAARVIWHQLFSAAHSSCRHH